MPADNDTLSAVGDLCGPVVLNQIGAPDAAARWTLSGTYGGALFHVTVLGLEVPIV